MIPSSQRRQGSIVLATAAVAIAATLLPTGPTPAETTAGLARALLVLEGHGTDALDADMVVEGYYEGLLDAAATNATPQPALADLLRVSTAAPPSAWKKLHETGAVDRSDPYLRFRLRPDLETSYKDAPLLTNAWGLRDDPVDLVAPAGTRRIALVGASITMGSGVPHEATFEAVLERELNARHRGAGVERFEVVNFAVAGYRLTQTTDVAVRAVPEFRPDAVLFVLSDIAVNARWWLHAVTLVREQADLRYDFLRAAVETAGLSPLEKPSRMAERLLPHRTAILQACLRTVIETTRAAGTELVIVKVPQPGHADALRERLRELDEVIADYGVPVLDLLPTFDHVEDPRTLWLRPYDRHPTAEGHRMLGERLYAELLADEHAARAVLGEAP